MTWLIYATLACMIWGLWGLFSKLAVEVMPAIQVTFYETAAIATIGIIIWICARGQFIVPGTAGLSLAILSGSCGILGTWIYLNALKSGGPAAIVTFITGMYPLVTLLLSRLFLKETLIMTDWLGIFFAVLAFACFSFRTML